MKKIDKQDLTKHTLAIIDSYGVSSNENGIVEYIHNNLKQYLDAIIEHPIGNLEAVIKSKTKSDKKLRLLIDTHMDELGLMIVNITEKGYIQFVPVGGWWEHSMLAHRYKIICDNGKEYIGIVGGLPIHILPKDQRKKVIPMEDLYLDIGVDSKQQVLDLGIRPGLIAVKDSNSFLMANPDYICGKAIDNRISCSALFYILKMLHNENIDVDVHGVFACQEEVGLRGAKSGAYNVNPDIAIVIDTTVSHDQHSMADHNDCDLNKGVSLEVLDAMVNSDKKFLNYIKKIAIENKIPFSYSCLTDGGTNGGYVYRARKGVVTIVLSIPTRYLHTHNEICNINDLMNCIKLVFTFIKNINYNIFKDKIL